MNIKTAITPDIPAIANIEQSCFSHPWSEQSIKESFQNNCNHFYVAEIEKKIAGYIGVSVMADEGYILNVAVLPDYRGQGLGEKLVNTVLNFAEENNLAFVTLEVRASNTPAINLYTKLGFEKVGERKNYYSNPTENALLLTKHYNSEKE